MTNGEMISRCVRLQGKFLAFVSQCPSMLTTTLLDLEYTHTIHPLLSYSFSKPQYSESTLTTSLNCRTQTQAHTWLRLSIQTYLPSPHSPSPNRLRLKTSRYTSNSPSPTSQHCTRPSLQCLQLPEVPASCGHTVPPAFSLRASGPVSDLIHVLSRPRMIDVWNRAEHQGSNTFLLPDHPHFTFGFESSWDQESTPMASSSACNHSSCCHFRFGGCVFHSS